MAASFGLMYYLPSPTRQRKAANSSSARAEAVHTGHRFPLERDAYRFGLRGRQRCSIREMQAG